MKLRAYQTELIGAIRAAWAGGRQRLLAVLPTGGGKTEVAIELIASIASPTTRALVVVERKVLAHQWRRRLLRHGIGRVGLIQAENTIAESAPVLVATIQSLRARGVPEDVALVVIDESHIWHRSHGEVLEALRGARVLGLSATPLRDGLGLHFDQAIIGATIRALIADGFLVRPRYFAPNPGAIAEALAEVALRAGDFAANELSKAMRGKAILGDVVAEWQNRASERQTIAFCVDKQHAHDLAAQFTAAGVSAAVVLDDTDDDERAAIFEAFDGCTLQVLCSVGVLSIGFDSPVASCAILARPTCSLSLHIQQGGRVLRPFEAKADALILDHAGNVERLGRLEDFTPPAELSTVERGLDKRSRNARAEVWTCRHCAGINALAEQVCQECGEPRVRRTAVVVLDGALREIDLKPGQAVPGPTPADVLHFYSMAIWYANTKGRKPGWAFHATCRRFALSDALARRLLPPPWQAPLPLPPDDQAARWFHSDHQRAAIAWRKSRAMH